jgi:hypothetical protein
MSDDVWESAENAEEPKRSFFGQVEFDMWFCALVKGQGKVPFDPSQHKQRFTAIDMVISPLSSSGATFNTERHLIAESKEWAGTILPSIKALGLTPRELNQKWVHYELVKTGSYTKNGEEKALTTPKFLAYFNTEEEAEQAMIAKYNSSNVEEDPMVNTNTEPVEVHNPTNGNGNEKAIAEKFIPVLVAQAKGDMASLANLIASNNLVAKYFNINSPEVLEALTKQAA